ncbi:MAG: NUDIX hydrolase [Spirochaetota bacterium]
MSEREYPSTPISGVGAVVFKDDKLLLIKRGKPPLEGRWSLPGGKTRCSENLVQALNREVGEECNIGIEIIDLVKLFEYTQKDDRGAVKYHYIVFDFAAEYTSGSLEHSSDASDALWVPVHQLHRYPLSKEMKEVIQEGWKVLKNTGHRQGQTRI